MTGALTRADLSVIDGDARVSDRQLAEVLGFKAVENIQRLIQRNEEELGDYGGVFRQTVGKPRSPKGGRPEVTYFLNEEQALLVCMFARSPRAREARREIITVYQAWRRGDLYRLAVEANVIPARTGQIARGIEEIEGNPDIARMVARLPHFPIWKGQRRPDFWKDVPVRRFLAVSHRQMTLSETVRIGRARYGDRCPGMSVVGRFWQRLDTIFGPAGFAGQLAPYVCSGPGFTAAGHAGITHGSTKEANDG